LMKATHWKSGSCASSSRFSNGRHYIPGNEILTSPD
jgi:hypothetical protein